MGKNNEIIYYAAAEILNADDAVNFGLKTFTIKKGNYCGVLLVNWHFTSNIVSNTFRNLLKHPSLNPNGYCLEIYLNENDMECLVKLND